MRLVKNRIVSLGLAPEPLVAVVFLLLVTLVLFAPWLVAGKVLAPLDLITEVLLPWRGAESTPSVQNRFVIDAIVHHIPYRILSERAFREDGYVGWNPLQSGGTAQHANTMVLNYEWSTQLHRFLDFWSAWHLGRMLHFLTAGLGMFVFLRSQLCHVPVALLGALSFMMNTQFITWIFFNPGLAGFGWVPFVLWAIYRARAENPRFAALAALFVTLALLGGTIQQAAFIVVAMSCVWLGWLYDSPKSLKNFVRTTMLFVIVGLLGAGMAAFMLEPSIAAFFENSRAGHGRGGFLYPFGITQPLLNMIAMALTPFAFLLGSPQTLDLGKALAFSLFEVGFFGTVPVILAIVSLFSRRVPTAAKLLMLAGATIPLTPLVGLLYHRINLLWIFGGCWGYSIWLSTAANEEIKKVTQWLLVGFVGFCSVWSAISVATAIFRPWFEPLLEQKVLALSGGSMFGMFTEVTRLRVGAFFDYIYIWNPWQLAGLIGFALSAWGLTKLRDTNKLGWLITPTGVTVQLVLFWFQWTPWCYPQTSYNKHKLVSVLQSEIGSTGRLAQENFLWLEGYFDPNVLPPLGVATVRGYDAIQPNGMRSPTEMPWDFPGSTHFLGRIGERAPAEWIEIWNDGDWCLMAKPLQDVGVLYSETGTAPLLREGFHRPTLNTMEADIPIGTTKVTLFSNWHRGWQWRKSAESSWKQVDRSSSGSVEVVFGKPLSEKVRIYFRFNPAPPLWVSVIVVLSIFFTVIAGLFLRMKLN